MTAMGIAAFATADNGQLSLLETEHVLGDRPWHFLVLEDSDRRLVAKQENHNVVAFEIAADGTFKPQRRAVAVASADISSAA